MSQLFFYIHNFHLPDEDSCLGKCHSRKKAFTLQQQGLDLLVFYNGQTAVISPIKTSLHLTCWSVVVCIVSGATIRIFCLCLIFLTFRCTEHTGQSPGQRWSGRCGFQLGITHCLTWSWCC